VEDGKKGEIKKEERGLAGGFQQDDSGTGKFLEDGTFNE